MPGRHLRQQPCHLLTHGEKTEHPQSLGEEGIDVGQHTDEVLRELPVAAEQFLKGFIAHAQNVHLSLCLYADGKGFVLGKEKSRSD